MQQVSRSLQFFFSSSQFDSVDHILLSGGVAAMSGIADLVESSLSTPTTVVNPFSGMDVSSKVDTSMLTNDTPSLMIACGLALRSFD